MDAKWSSPIGGALGFARKHRTAQQAGLKAAAYIVTNEVKRNLAGGYTSGNFTNGIVLNSVTMSDIFEDLGVFGIRVGSNLKYALYWEIGHHNIFTRKYERVEVWRPALSNTREDQRAAYNRAYKRSMLGGG